MALIKQVLTTTVTDDLSTDPDITVESNFTEDTYDKYDVRTIKIEAGAAGSVWTTDSATTLIDLSASAEYAKYIIVTTDNPIYSWLGITPTVSTDTKFNISNVLVLSGSTDKLFAVNPSRADDTSPVDCNIKVTYVYG